jgi:ubiquinone/menaquinone biosynthesis C-methylase UbiE
MRKYKPKDHGENRMKNEGDVILARENFYEFKNKNLEFLIRKRFSWMNKFINKNHQGIEVGCGTGVSKEYIKNDNYMISDFSEHNFLDYKNIDALNTGFKDESFDFVVSSNMIHHVPYPMKFFNEMHRILKSEGLLIIQEINCSYMMMKLLRLMRHEGFDFTIDVYDSNLICTDEDDLWSANCAIPNLLFDNILKF